MANILDTLVKEGTINIAIPRKSLIEIGVTILISGTILILATYLLFKLKK